MRRAAAAPDRPVRTVSLSRRVTVWVIALLALVLAGLGVAVHLILGNALRNDLAQRISDRAGYAAVLQANGVTGQDLADELTGEGIASSFVSGRSEYVGRDNGRPPRRPEAAAPQAPATPADITLSRDDTFVTATVVFADGTLTLQAGEFEIQKTLAELRRIELLAGGAALLIAGLLVSRVAVLALRPLDRMTGLARRIRDGARGRRLRPTKPGTDLGRTAVAMDEMLDSLEAAEAQARSAEDRMRQFLADASHDLRTPLAGVISGAERLLREPGSRAEREDRLVALVRQAQRAARLVDDLLTMTRLDAAGPDTEGPPPTRVPVDPAELLRREAETLLLRRPDLLVELSTDPVVVAADPDQLQRALGNLLDNCGRACGPGGLVQVRLSALDSGVHLSVTDNGTGIPAEAVERIFDRFVRLNPARDGAGSGLGLPISRAILRAHGGDLVCLPWVGGARFEAWLPGCPTPSRGVRDGELATSGRR